MSRRSIPYINFTLKS